MGTAGTGWSLQPADVTLWPSSTAHDLFASASPPVYLPPHAAAASAAKPHHPALTDGAEQSDVEPSHTLSLFQAAILESAAVPVHSPPHSQGEERPQHQKRAAGKDNANTASGAEGVAAAQGESLGTWGAQHGTGAARDADGPQVAAADVIMCTGGLVWSTAFCPALPPSPSPRSHPPQQQQPQPGHKRRRDEQSQQQQPSQQQMSHFEDVGPSGGVADEVSVP